MEAGMEIEEILDHSVMRHILDSLTKATGLRSVIVNTLGEELLEPLGVQEECTFCRTIKRTAGGYDKCRGSYMRAGREAAKFGEPYIFRCHAGLIAWAAPLVISGKYIGAIISGQVLMWEPEEFFWIEVSEMNQEVGEIETLVQKGKELQVISAEKVEATAYLLFMMANHLMKMGMVVLEQRREMAEQQARLGAEIFKRKMLEQTLKEVKKDAAPSKADLNIEKELLLRMKIGDRSGMLELLHKIVADMLDRYGSRLQMFRVKIWELLALLSRTAVEDEIEENKVLALNAKYMEEVSRSESLEDLCYWICQAAEEYSTKIYRKTRGKNTEIITEVLNYIWQNFQRPLSLEEIAAHVYLSPYHLSHIFKKEVGFTVMESVTKARMEEAKRLLRHSDDNVAKIAKNLGYNDPGHFSKVFKRSEGVMPKEFKRRLPPAGE